MLAEHEIKIVLALLDKEFDTIIIISIILEKEWMSSLSHFFNKIYQSKGILFLEIYCGAIFDILEYKTRFGISKKTIIILETKFEVILHL
jgi:hypothetical protein